MEPQKQKVLAVQEQGKNPVVMELDVPQPKPGQLLIKIQASTINPSDRYSMKSKTEFPAVVGLEGTGRVIKAEGEENQNWVGKRVAFASAGTGTWASYCTTSPHFAFEIDEDVSIQSAASGVVNPLTVICMLETFRTKKYKGIIHTAAASALGRMLNKICQKENIPLLNVVRRQEQAELLKSQGAKNVLITAGDWQPQYKEFVNKEGYDCLFDALGGGQVTKMLIQNIADNGAIYIYGRLSAQPLQVDKVAKLFSGVSIHGYYLRKEWFLIDKQTQNKIRANYSNYLKNQLSTKTAKELTFDQVQEALDMAVNKTIEGKVLLRPI